MKRSLFAVTSLVTAAGFAAAFVGVGCSDDSPKTSTATNEPEQTQTPPKKSSPPPSDSTNDDSSDDDSTEAPATCMSTTPFDFTAVPYKSPAVKANSCSTADVKAFDDYLAQNPSATVDDLQTMLGKQNQKCADCAFGEMDADTWAPIVSDGKSATLNGGGCVSVVSGKDDCGKAYQQWNACLNTVCAPCSDPDERSQCSNDAQAPGSACGDASDVLFKACGSKVNTYLKTCFGSGIGAVVEQLCGAPATKDGGT